MTKQTNKSATKIGRPARISRQAIAEAALDIGLDNATMVAIAERLGVDHSSLYRHVKGRDDILSAAVDLAASRIDWTPPASDWREAVTMTAESAWAMYEKHGGLAEAIRFLDMTPREIVTAFVAMSRQLETFGFSTLDAILVVDTVMDMTNDAAAGLRRIREKTSKGPTVEAMKRDSWKAPDPASDEARIGAAMWAAYSSDPKAWWQKKLGVVIKGAEALLAEEKR